MEPQAQIREAPTMQDWPKVCQANGDVCRKTAMDSMLTAALNIYNKVNYM